MTDIAILGLSGQSLFMEVEHFHLPGETLRCETLFAEPGGKGYNQAVAAARMGARVGYISAIGDDAYGGICQARMAQEGVHAHWVMRREESTALAVILTDAHGENRVTVYPGASQTLTSADIDAAANEIRGARLLLLQLECGEPATLRAAQIAREANVPIVLNPAPAHAWGAKLLDRALCITPNESEAVALFGLNEGDMQTLPQMACSIWAKRQAATVVTLGARGALVMENGTAHRLYAPPVIALDTTGAGDAFNAGLCVGLAKGESLLESARRGVAAATLSVQHKHVLDGMPYGCAVDGVVGEMKVERVL